MMFLSAFCELRVAALEAAAYDRAMGGVERARKLVAAGKAARAIAILRKELKRSPRDPEATQELGQLLYQQGQPAEAARWLLRTIELAPPRPDLHSNAALALAAAGRAAEAVESMARAIELEPRSSKLYLRHAELLASAGRVDAADEALQRAGELAPGSTEVVAARARLLIASDRAVDAETVLREALARAAASAPLHSLLGDCLHSVGRLEEAVAAYRAALELRSSAAAWESLGCAQLALTDYAGAVESLEQCLAMAAGSAAAHYNLGEARYRLGDVEGAIASFTEAGRSDELAARATGSIAVVIPGAPKADHQAVLAARRRVDERLPKATVEPSRWPAARPVRVGYVSAYFDRPNWMKPVWGLFNHHDRSAVALHLFSDVAVDTIDPGYQRRDGDVVHDISALDATAAAAAVRAAEIDVLVDLNGYSRLERLELFALRPAAVQVAWFNYYATSGIAAIDYIVGDDVVVTPEEEPFYSESSTLR